MARKGSRKASKKASAKNMTVVELRKLCKSAGISGYSKMNKAQLVKACGGKSSRKGSKKSSRKSSRNSSKKSSRKSSRKDSKKSSRKSSRKGSKKSSKQKLGVGEAWDVSCKKKCKVQGAYYTRSQKNGRTTYMMRGTCPDGHKVARIVSKDMYDANKGKGKK